MPATQPSRLHLKFKQFHAATIRATDELFASRPWTAPDEDRHAAFERWLRRVADAYNVPVPTLEINIEDPDALNGGTYELGQITLGKYSVLMLFHMFRHHMQELGAVEGLQDSDRHSATETESVLLMGQAEIDAVSWSCSLFYKVRPVAFRKAVRRGLIRYVTPDELLSSASLAARRAARERRDQDALDAMESEFTLADLEDIENDDVTARTDSVVPTPDEQALWNGTMLTTAEVAELLGISRSRVMQIKDRLGGELRGRSYVFPRAAIEVEQARRAGTVVDIEPPTDER